MERCYLLDIFEFHDIQGLRKYGFSYKGNIVHKCEAQRKPVMK